VFERLKKVVVVLPMRANSWVDRTSHVILSPSSPHPHALALSLLLATLTATQFLREETET